MRAPSAPCAIACSLAAALISVSCIRSSHTENAETKYSAPDERFVFFTSGSAQVVANDGFFSLGYVVALLDAQPRYYVLIVGHADPTGSDEANTKLSFARARAVRQILIDHGVTEKRVLIAAPKKRMDSTNPELSRRADVYVYDPVEEEVSHRLGYEVEIRER